MTSIASLSVDLDNHWSYLKTHGDESWRGFPTYLPSVVPRILEFCDDLEVAVTIFVVGQDAELPSNAEPLAQIGASRHEVGNHSFNHEPWLHLKSDTEIDEEIARAHGAILEATGKVAIGFRGPGFSVSKATIETLERHGYVYDASTLPTFIGPLARAFYMRASTLDDEELQRRGLLFGKFSEGFRPIKPYVWNLGSAQSIIEIPVTTMPLTRLPIHATYLLYLARTSPWLANAYLHLALLLCRTFRVEPSLLLHSLDFIGKGDADGLGFFPGMDMEGARKRELLHRFVDAIGAKHEIVPMKDHADSILAQEVKSLRVDSLA